MRIDGGVITFVESRCPNLLPQFIYSGTLSEVFVLNYKTCNKCNLLLPESKKYFYFRSDRGKFRNDCIDCNNKKSRKYYENADEQWEDGKERKCGICRKQYPNTSEHFYNKYNKSCKSCRSITNKNYRLSNLKEINEKDKKRYYENKDMILKRQKKYRRSESGRVVAIVKQQRRRARMKMVNSDFTKKDWQNALTYFEDSCAYCGTQESLEQEHFIALSKGGGYTKDNILPCCRTCNASKNDKCFFEWYPQSEFYSKQRRGKVLGFLNCN